MSDYLVQQQEEFNMMKAEWLKHIGENIKRKPERVEDGTGRLKPRILRDSLRTMQSSVSTQQAPSS